MARPELGTKRVCPTTGRKFYDLNRDPIVSPYTGQPVPRSILEPARAAAPAAAADDEDDVDVDVVVPGAEVISLEEADAGDDAKVAVVDDEVVLEEEEATTDDAFLEEEEGGDDVADLIESDIEDDEEA